MELLPDLASLSDADLKKLMDDLIKQEDEVSFQRRMLHGKIDILRAELTARLKGQPRGTLLSGIDVDRLSEILVTKGFPPDKAE